ncbi:hypothetical protein [Methanoregula sp.]|uniref:hypothetical protein n=1 Tax=Methanoregula sp. TaxID=2052170 RepID=UPI003BB0CA84
MGEAGGQTVMHCHCHVIPPVCPGMWRIPVGECGGLYRGRGESEARRGSGPGCFPAWPHHQYFHVTRSQVKKWI